MKLTAALISIWVLMPGVSTAQTSIDAVYFGQTHVKKPGDSYFSLVGNRETLIKAHVINPATPAAPAVTATLALNGQNLVLPLTGPATLPASIPDGPGVVQHSFANTFTGYIPPAWVKTGLQVTVNAGSVSRSFTNLNIGAPSKVIMTMFDVHYFSQTTGDYPANTLAEVEAKWPVAELEVRRLRNIVFPELVIPPRPDVGTKAARIKSKAEYTIQTGKSFDGEQAAALAWNAALKRAAGRSGRWSLYYMNIYNAFAGGQAGGFAGVGSGTNRGILHHELGHALSLPHWGSSSSYPYKGAMFGIPAPSTFNQTHAGPTWAFDLRTKAFIPPTVQPNNVGGYPAGTYKVDPMEGGGTGREEPGYLLNHFSDYSVNQMRSYLHSHMVVWNPALGSNGSYASWNQTTRDYTTTVTNNGVQFPTTRDTEVISIMASISGSNPGVTMVYPPIGPYTSGLIRLFDPTVAADRTAAQSIFSPANGSDLCVRVVQGGVTKTYMLAASWLTNQDPKSSSSLVTEAINLPASAGAVTKIELLLTPDAQINGLPANPQVLSTWAPLMPEPAAFAAAPVAYSPSAITMKAKTGEVAFGFTGTVEYKFTETTGNPGGTSSAWQTSPSYTDTGLQANTQYAYTVSMRAGTLTAATSAAASATTLATSAPNNVTINSTQQFTLQSGGGLRNVNSLGSFNAAGADKLVVVISTEDGNNSGVGYVYEVRYNGKTMKEAIQEHGGPADGSAAIFYLDNPGSIGTGTLQVSAENPNGGIGAAYALSNTMPGFGVTNSRSGSAANSVSLTTAGERSMVIAVLTNSGKPNSAGTPAANSPLIPVSSGSWGSGWGSHASGYQLVAAPAAITPSFSTLTGSGYNINIAAAEFPAKPGTVPVVLPNVWTQADGGTQNWTTASNWQDGVIPNPTSTTTMDFSKVDILADTALNLGANRTARVWKFGDTSGTENWTINAGNSMTLAGTTPTIQVDNNTTRIDAVVAGTAGLAKTGAGTLILSGSNSYTGGTTMSAGTLQFAKTAAMPASGTVAVGTGTTLTVNLGGTGEWTTATSGNGSIGGLLGGIGGQGAPVSYTGTTTVAFDTTNAGGDQTYSGVIANVGTTLGLGKQGAGTLILTSNNTYTGPTTISGGALRLSGAGRLNSGNYAGAVFIASDATLEYSGSSGQTLSGAITGGGNLKSTTNVDFIMSNKDNDFGSFTIGSGRVFINSNAGALPSAAAVNITGGLLAFGSVTAVADNPFTIGSGGGIVTRRSGGTTLTNVRLPGTGTVIFNNDDANTGTLIITNDQITDEYDPDTGELNRTGAQIITGNLTMQIGGGRMTTTTASLGGVVFAGKISGPGSLTVTSGGNSGNTNGLFRSGVLTLTGANDYAGGTTISTGTLALGESDVIPDTPLAIANGRLDAATFTDTLGTLAITGSATINLGDGAALAFANSSAVNWPGTLTLTGNFVSGSSIRFGNNGTALTATQLSKIGSTAFSSFSLNSDGYLVGTPTGGPTYTITNTTTDGNGACTPTGVTTVGGGGSQTYTLTPNPGYAVATLTVNGVPVTPALSYTFDNVSANQTISATFVNIAEAPLYWDSNGATPGYGSITGTWGSSSFWTVDASGASAPIAVTTETNTSVNFGSATLNYNQSAVTISDGGVSAGTITFGAGQSTPLTLGGGAITLGETAIITVNNASNTIASVLAGAETSLTKAGSGILTLSGANTYTGDTILSAGTLKLGASNVIPDGPGMGNVILTGTLDLNTFSETLNGLTGNGTVNTLAGGTPILTLGAANATSTFNGTITGTLSLIKTGNGTLTIAGANGYSGQTTISDGILVLSGAGTLGSTSSALTLGGGRLDLGGLSRTQGAVSITAAAAVGDTLTNGTLSGSSFAASNITGNAIIPASLTGPGGFSKSGDGTTTLTAANSYAGKTTISGGMLQFAKATSLYNGNTGNWSAANIAVGSSGTLALNVGGTGEFTTANVTTLLTNLGGANGTTSNGLAAGSRIGFDTTNASGGSFTVADAIANSIGTGGGAIGLTKLGTGTLNLTTSSTYTGPTTITDGTLRLSGSGRLNSGNYAGSITIGNGATFEQAGSQTQTLSGTITGNGGNVILSSTSAGLILSNAANTFGSLTLATSASGSRVFINNSGSLPTAAAVTINAGILVFNNAASGNYDSVITLASGGGIAARATTGVTLTNVTLPGSGTVVFNNDDQATRTVAIESGQTLSGNLTVQIGGGRMTTTTSALGGVTLSGTLSGDGSLTVTSGGNSGNTNGLFASGVLTLTGPNDYTGDTIVNSGVLAVTGNSIADTGKLVINGGGKVNLSNAETVATLFFGSAQQPSGTYGATGVPAGATITTASFSGGGTLIVLPPAASAYTLWAATNAPTTGTNPYADEDNDGVSNAVEFVLGGNAQTNDLPKLPTASPSGDNILFSFKRDQASIHPGTSVIIETGTTLLTWPGSYVVGTDTATSSAGVIVTQGVPTGFDTVTLSIPRSPDLQKFLRLKVTVSP
jgi:autotransporter-associated beta strand protein